MLNSRYSNRSSSVSSADSNHQSPQNRLKTPLPSDYEYLGRLVTRERPIIRKSQSLQQNHIFPRNTQKYHHSMGSHQQEIYEDVSVASNDDDNDIDDPDGLNKPLGVIRISDRHFREIYRLPTPPPKVKRVYHRLRSPEPKVIERVYVRRPPPQVIENIIEVPPEKIRIIKREKYLEKTTPITRSKLVHLKSRRQQREEEQQQQTFLPSEQQTYIPSEQYSQQESTTAPFIAPQQTTTTNLVYPPQPNMPTVGYVKSTIPPHIMFNSQQPLQFSPQQLSNQQMVQPTSYAYSSQQPANHQMVQPTPHTYPSQQPASYQMVQPTPHTYPSQQPASYQMVQPTPHTYPSQQPASYQMVQPTPHTYPSQQPVNYQMTQPTPFTYAPQQTIPNSPYGYTQH